MLESKFHRISQSQEENQFRSIVSLIMIMQELNQVRYIKQGLFYIVIQHR